MMTSNIPARTSEDSYLFRTEPPLLSNTGERKRKRNQMTYDEDFDKNFTMNRDFKPVKTEVKKQSEPARPIDVANGSMNRQLLADYISRSTNRFGFNLSQAEMDRLYLPENAFRDTSEWMKPRNLIYLTEFLEDHCFKHGGIHSISSAFEKSGAPHTLFITLSGLRAADATRVLRKFQTKDGAVSKLFAKHIRLTVAIEHVKKTSMAIGVGTPGRIKDLLDAGALSLDKLERLVIDCSHVDLKGRSIFDMRETQLPLVQVLTRDELKSRYRSSGDKVDLLCF